MAINVNEVYQTVLLILNKEQRGYMTPEEFNKTATQVQRKIFERYFEDLNQQLRVSQSEFDYADRVANIDEKIAEFKTEGVISAAQSTDPPYYNFFQLPSNLYRINTVTFDSSTYPPQPTGYGPEQVPPPIYPQTTIAEELQRVGRTEFYNINKSPLTKPDFYCPIYLYEDNKVLPFPNNIDSLRVTYVKKPNDINWGFTTIANGAYVYDPTSSVNFELHNSEQIEVVINILLYAGVVIKDPQIVQVANNEIQQEEVNEKQ